MNIQAVRGHTYDQYAIKVTYDAIMIYPLDVDLDPCPAFQINERTAKMLEDAAKIVRTRLTDKI